MSIQNHEIQALFRDMARVLDDAEEITRNLKGQKKVKLLVEQDVRTLRHQIYRLDKHLAQLGRESSRDKHSNHQSRQLDVSDWGIDSC